MSKIDEKYISALESFTEALAEIVETLKEQQKTGKADTVNEMLKNSSEGLGKVVKDLKKVTQEGFKDVKNQNSIIERKIDGIKKQKESGMFDKIEDPKNKNKIVDGIKVVVLIAAGVLALGMAFKIIGKVDFISVLALSAAMVAMAFAYTKISDTKGLSFGKIFRVAMILPIMALGLAASGYLLRNFPKIGLMQGISIMVVSGALGLATYLISKALGKLSTKSLIMIPLIPFILPLIALGIVKASYILKDVKQLTLMQVFSVALVGLALGVATFGIGLALKGMKNISWKEMLALPIMIPLIAGGIVLASTIFQAFVPIKNPLQLLLGSLVMGVSILMFTPAVYILGKLNFSQIVKGSIGVLAVAGAILGVAWIFSLLPAEMRYPGFMWSLGAGLSIIGFGLLSVALGLLTTLVTPIVFGIGLLALLAVAGAILGVAWIFSLLPAEMRYPGFMWSLGAGLSIIGFGLLSVALGLLTTLVTPIVFGIGLLALLAVAGSMVGVSLILNQGKWDGPYPSLGWALGVGGSLLIFSLAAVAASVGGLASAIGSLFTGGEDPLVKMANTMVLVSLLLQKGIWNKGYPSYAWSMGVGTALLMFTSAYATITALEGFNRVLSFLTGGKSKSFDEFVLSAIGTMIVAREMLNVGDWKSAKHPTYEWSLGIGTALATFALAYATIMAIEGAGRVFAFFTGGKSKSFDQFVISAVTTMVVARDMLNIGDWSSAKHPTGEWALGVGTALAMFATAYAVITGIEGIGRVFSFLTGGKAQSFNDFVVSASSAMSTARGELAKGDWSNAKLFPSKEWAEGVGMSLFLFARSYAIISSVPNFMSNAIKFLTGNKDDPFNKFVISAMHTMITARNILSKSGTWNTANSYPSKDYVAGVGAMLTVMAEAYSKFNSMGFFETMATIFGGKKRVSLDTFVISASTSIVTASTILGKGNYGQLPDKKYLDNFGYLIEKMADIMSDFQDDVDLDEIQSFNTGFRIIMTTLSIISKGDYKNFPEITETNKLVYFIVKSAYSVKNTPSPETFLNFNIGMSYFVAGINKLSTLKPLPTGFMNSFNTFLEFLNKMPEKSLFFSDKYDNIKEMAKSVNMLAESFSNLNKGMLSFLDMSKGLFLISVIDDVKLGKVLQSVQKHQQALKIVNQVPEEQSNLLDVIKNLYGTIPAIIGGQSKEEGPKFEGKDSEKKQKDKFYNDIAEIKSALYQLLDNFDKPTQAGSFHK